MSTVTLNSSNSHLKTAVNSTWKSVQLTLWRPLLPYGYSYKASCARLGYAVICNFWHPGPL